MDLSPDQYILWSIGRWPINLTIVMTWLIMGVMTIGSMLITRRLQTDVHIPRWQGLLEVVVTTMESQTRDVGLEPARRYLPFLGTLFLFIAVSALLTVFPGFVAPTGSLSTTTALALLVFVAVPTSGIMSRGFRNYLAGYLEPSPLLLPFNVIGELSRTLALAIRLFGNMMSGAMIMAIALTIAPLVFPAILTLFGLLTGMVQAYIFAILAAVFMAAATRAQAEAAGASSARPPADRVSEPSHLGSAHE